MRRKMEENVSYTIFWPILLQTCPPSSNPPPSGKALDERMTCSCLIDEVAGLTHEGGHGVVSHPPIGSAIVKISALESPLPLNIGVLLP